MEWLGSQLGLKIVQEDILKQEYSVSSLLRRRDAEPDLGYKPVTGFMYAGKLQLSDIPAKLLHTLVKDRNWHLGDYARKLARVMPKEGTDTRLHLDRKLKFHMNAPMPQSHMRGYHSEFFRALSLGDDGTPEYRYWHNSWILTYFIPTINIFKYVNDKTRLEDFRESQTTAGDYDNWKNFVLSDKANFSKFFSQSLSAYIDFEAFKEHGYVLGATKAGKTELLKVIIHHIITNTMKHNCSIPDDHIAPRRSALFMARWVLTEARDGRATC